MRFSKANLVRAHIAQTTRSMEAQFCELPTQPQSWEEDISMLIIVAVVVSALVAAACLPQVEWFKEWTGIHGWIPFLESLFERL